MHHTHRPPHCPGRGLSRRNFLTALGASAAGIVLAPATKAFGYGNVTSRVAVATATNYEPTRVLRTMEALFDGIGGLADIVRPGDRVGIKINLTGGLWNATNYESQSGKHPGETIWTHPEVIRAVGMLLRDAGASQVYVLEAAYDPWANYTGYGYVAATAAFEGTFVDLNNPQPFGSFVDRSTGSQPFIYQSFTQNGVLNELDCVVSLAKSKQHAEAGVTHGMKNLVGSVPLSLYSAGQGSRQALHRHRSYDGDTHSNLCRVVLDLNGATPIRLVVNDAVQTVLGGEGPWHRLQTVSFDTFVASKDPVAADVVATQSMGFDPTAQQGSATFPESINYLQLAESMGLGVADPAQIDVVSVRPTGTENGHPETPFNLNLYPNPFHEQLSVDLNLRESAYVRLSVCDIRGGRVATLLQRSVPVGKTTVEWRPRGLAAGTYLVVMQSGGKTLSRKAVRV